MKKWILLGCTAALAMGLYGCGQTENAIPETTVLAYEPHITMALRENCIVDADVEAPENPICTTPGAALWEPTPETIAAVLFPQAQTTLQEIDPESYGFSLTTASGACAEFYPGSLYFFALKTAPEAAQFMAQYQSKHPEKTGEPLEFLTSQDAVALGRHILKELGLSLEPVLDAKLTMTHADFQEQQIFNWDDTFYLRFTFSYDGIPLYGTMEEPELPFLDYNNVPPAKSQAEMLITSQGIQYLRLTGIYTVVNSGDFQARITPRSALQLLRQFFADQEISYPHQVTRICLQYLPITRDMGTSLVPYWSFWMDYQYIDEYDGKTVSVKDGKVERFNAYTGENYRFGG